MTLDETYQLGYILKTHGLRGHVAAHFDVDDVADYLKLKKVYLALPAAPTKLVEHKVEKVQSQSGNRVLLKLHGIDRIEEAEPLRGSQLYLPLAELPELEDDQFYFHDVIGFTVVDENLGELGTVENFYELPQQDMLAMRYQGQEVLIPVVDELVSHADHEKKQVHVKLPEGLLDVYLKPSSRDKDEPDEFDEA
ncbi:ribosome maturation factor RimM [Hymenobacter properus]|uniref:Ribosome maturation factor RimM n=1 Tax=Hymenobacter properus TaxID=2791026 RepID=A0A931BDT5_9BACT|nr:ribosome maturation factor RimM [Hymenobacter properus]MBF9142040.1 16S rRNA processing protein RimM [Hymenobacter properus]MBR7720847.1 16S rRNA processing protein RimM [Microvirga sp. SRT04]